MGARTLTMEAHNSSAAGGNGFLNSQEKPQPCARGKLDEMIAGDSLDYNSWKSLISEIETASPDDIDTISVAYDYFLSNFPLCHWFWEKYAYHKLKLCGAPEAVKIFERGVKAAECSVGFWVDYFKFGTSFFGDPSDVRRLFGRGLSCVGKDYFCHVLWDAYLKYEFNQEGWSFLAQSYIEALKFPTKKLLFYYDNFKKFVTNLEEEMGYENSWSIDVEKGSAAAGASKINKNEISLVVKDLLDSSDRSIKSKALDRYKSIGNQFYQEARLLDEEIKNFETNIRRRYFHVTPLDDDELTNWHRYLDFIEKQEDLDWAVKLYERCLISCANYPEFWIRYVEFLESKRGRQLAISVLDRATQIFLKNVPEIHIFNARFKEQIGDADGARAALLLCDAKTDSSFIASVINQANMEKRLGNLAAASATYEKGLKIASEKQKLHILPTLYFHFARLTFMITGSADAARDVINRGIQHVPHCRFLLEELIKFSMTREGASQVNIVESIIVDAISPGSDKSEGLNAKDREDISSLFLEFVDLCGTVNDVRRAWNRHVQLFPRCMRIRALCKKPISGNHLLNAAADQSRFKLAGLGIDQASKTQSSDHLIKLAEQEQVPVLAENNDVQPHPVLEDKSMQMDDDNNKKEKLQRPSTEVAVVSKEYASRDDDLSHNSIHHSGDHVPGSVESTLDLTCRPKDDKRELMEVTTELVRPHELTREVSKSLGPTGSVEALRGCSGSVNVDSEPDHELQQHKQPVSLNNVALNSQAKESQGFMPMSCKEFEATKGTSASSRSPSPNFPRVNYNASASPKSIQTVDSPQLPNESDKDRSENHQNHTLAQVHPNPEVSSRTDENSHPINHIVTTAGQSPLSSPPVSVSYSQQNMLQSNLQSSRQPGQMPHDQAMNQMLQYQYQYQQQQHFLQQQYQLQQPVSQVQQHYVQHPPYQLQSQQQQQHAQLAHQQQYVQQMQQYYQQQMQQQYYQQNQQLASHMHQQGYQHAAHGHELLSQQYQLYKQGYPPMQVQQGHHQMQEQNVHQNLPETPQHENLQQRHQVTSEQNLTQSLSQHQQDQDVATPDFDGAPEPFELSLLQGQSPKLA
ncbi:unnamed protein product [Fraxinus pennsylvanica]|uniref:Pre-mRNA-processing factor 39 n=1 Tax=Fraxinus pennsylvanica TaxID=56036 RepID=A0AAD2E9A7_9LAMI|nr:unnamed protein product [Fraxinus pennsylvanica]